MSSKVLNSVEDNDLEGFLLICDEWKCALFN